MKLSQRGVMLGTAIIAAVVAAALITTLRLQSSPLPAGFTSGNGRIEATEIDVATKIPGRIKDILVQEGEFVRAGQILARMDTTTLEAQRRESEAQLQRALIAVQTAESLLAQREAEKNAAIAVLEQRDAERDAAQQRLARSVVLAPRNAIAKQTLDDDRARYKGAQAAVHAAQAEVAAATAAVAAARSNIINEKASVAAMHATIERIQADIDDCVLTSPRDGRVQYRVAEPGEVLPSGGRVISLVDLSDVYMVFYLPTREAGQVALGAEARIVLDAAPEYVIPATVSFVSNVSQFTPKMVETAQEREKLMFRVKARVPIMVLRRYLRQVKTGLPGVAYVRLDSKTAWPARFRVRLPK